MTIETLEPSDWERGREIRLRALRDCPDAFGSTLERELQFSDDDWRRRLERTDATTIVAKDAADADVGLIVGAPYDEDAGLYSMWIAPKARQHGIGGRLVDAVIAWSRGQQHQRILLDVGDWNVAAIRLYASKGFQPTGIASAFPPPRQHLIEHQRELLL